MPCRSTESVRSWRSNCEVTGLLGHPLPCRVGGDPGEIDPSGVELDEEQYERRLSRTGSTVKKSQAIIVCACARRNSTQVGFDGRGAVSMPCLRRIAHTLEGAIRTPIVTSSPWIRR